MLLSGFVVWACSLWLVVCLFMSRMFMSSMFHATIEININLYQLKFITIKALH